MELLTKLKDFSKLNPETIPMVYDILRTIVMQFTVQFLFYMNNPGISLFSSMFIQTTLFLILGTVIFWLIVYKIVANNIYFDLFDTKINDKKDIKE